MTPHTFFGRVRAVILFAVLVAPCAAAAAPPPLATGYRAPPEPLATMVDAPSQQEVSISPDRRSLAIFGSEGLPPVAALARPVLGLAGYRIDPRTNGPAEVRMEWLTSLSFADIDTGAMRPAALPKGMRFANPQWSPDGRRLAFMAQSEDGLELWLADRTGAVRRLTGPVLNAAFGDTPFAWRPDGSGLVIRTIDPRRGALQADNGTPDAPVIQEASGRVIAGRTYEDLLGSPRDESLFDYYFGGRMALIGVDGGEPQPLDATGIISHFALSPDGRFLLLETIRRPYSHMFPAARFPVRFEVIALAGGSARLVAERGLSDDLPSLADAAPKGPRQFAWRADTPATLTWVEAADGGDPRTPDAVKDRLFALTAPFDGTPQHLADLPGRLDTVFWGDQAHALATARWWKTRRQSVTAFDPSGRTQQRMLVERNLQDPLTDPGTPLMKAGPFHEPVMAFASDGSGVLMSAPGASASGGHPFLAAMDLLTGHQQRIWTSVDPFYEVPLAVLSEAADRILTRRESHDTPPNYVVRSLRDNSVRAVTRFTDPMPDFAHIEKRLITYQRADGLPLSATLYLPKGYVIGRDKPLATLLWAYPMDYLDRASAGVLVDQTTNRFIRPSGSSHLFLAARGYAIVDGPSMPIVGAKGAQANDTYIEQLSADAEAAVSKLVEMGVSDRNRIGIGGHSYGAFMTVNLLAHTSLFQAGVAESGAYNRTLTPFGFQTEERTYWDAVETYTRMSPFTYVKDIKAPLLLIHGAADENSGTFPIQSERLFAAIKGVGGKARYVSLPYETHRYRSREANMDVLAEMSDWLDRNLRSDR